MNFPVRFIPEGNHAECLRLRGEANRLMFVLEDIMQLRGLDQYSIMIEPYVGATIECSKIFGRRTIRISAGSRKITYEKKTGVECFCAPHFAFAIITGVTPLDPDPEDPVAVAAHHELLIHGMKYLYTADVCTGKGFVTVEDIVSAGWERYYVGQFVLVTISQEITDPEYPPYDCDRDCLMQEPRFSVLAVCALHAQGYMKKWKTIMTETFLVPNG
jgi:hypothetical protein